METREQDFNPENKPETSVEKELSAWDSIKTTEAKERAQRLGEIAVKGAGKR